VNYSELSTAIAGYTHRDDISAMFGTFVALFESRVNRKLRVAAMETTATLVMSGGVIALPADYLELRSAKTGTTTLQLVTPDRLLAANGGIPTVYSISGGNIYVNADCTLTIGYYQTIPPLTSSSDTNWLITQHPDAYLSGILAEAFIYTMDDTNASKNITLRDQILDDIRHADKNSRWAGTPTRISPSNTLII
jgi:hypothetical protein